MDLQHLNEQQREAALHTEGPLLILAGAGSGKTATMTHRIAYLIEQGIPSERILVESKSTDTNENLDNAKEMIEAHSGKNLANLKVKIISSDYHCFRAKMIAKRHGYTQVTAYGAGSHPLLIPSFYTREGLALVKSFLLDR